MKGKSLCDIDETPEKTLFVTTGMNKGIPKFILVNKSFINNDIFWKTVVLLI